MKPKRVYIDTSVVGGCLEAEFQAPSVALFEHFRAGRLVMVVSDLFDSELRKALSDVRAIMQDPAPNGRGC